MAFKVEETGELTRTANVTVEREQYEKKVNNELRKLSRRVKIRGFRKGKIPLKVMKQRYGQAVIQDVVQDLVNQNLNEVLDEMDSVLHLGTPQVTHIPLDDDGDLTFSVDLELRPKIDPIGYLGLEVDKPKVEIEAEAIDDEIEGLREQFATNEPVELRETIAEGDIVTVDIQALGEHEELEAMKGKDVLIEVGSGNTVPGIEEALEGKAFDAVVETEIELDKNFPVEELQEQRVTVELKVKKVERRVLPEVNDDFAQQTGKGETLLELRSHLRESLEADREKEARRLAIDNMMDTLLEQNPFELPPQFLKAQVERSANQRLQTFRSQGLDPDQFGLTAEALAEQIEDDVIRQVHAELLLMEIAGKEKIEVEDQDLLDYFEETATQMGVNAQQYMAFMRNNEEMMSQARATVQLDKTRNYLLSEATINEVEWPEEEEIQGHENEALQSDGLPEDQQAEEEESDKEE